MLDGLSSLEPFFPQLLGRALIEEDNSTAEEFLSRHRILVTGAGGSIGSALTEMLLHIGPSQLVLLDHHENSLFQLRQRVMAEGLCDHVPTRFILADVRDRRKIAAVLDELSPEIVFHLAAYKHVPLAEDSPEEFVSINVLGTWHLLAEARRVGVKKIVYPSTDKAVNPPSIYGATKKAVEIMLQAVAAEEPNTKLTAVRLVNVLGAHGGVIEIFERQIRSGRSPTITDPAMTRYWITLQEALYLLAQAAASNDSGNILVLDLGDPVKVADIALELWKMLRPANEEFRAQCIGMRPGERLSEYLVESGEFTAPTPSKGILQVKNRKPKRYSLAQMKDLIGALQELIDANAKAELRDRLFTFVQSARESED
ncbi:MAG: SDR family NAD(P)-dependent oxidoreductase [Dehalococcoidales bacterium]|nr:SDR family NAD(P)-dependent oxidoreductase [Dehalococcoidales bacterium]